MLLFFVLIIFFLLHIQFLLRNLFFGVSELPYFNFTLTYPYGRETTIESLIFSVSCAATFAVGYKVSQLLLVRRQSITLIQLYSPTSVHIWIANLFAIISIGYMLTLGLMTGFDYGAMVNAREVNSFVLELRVVFLLLLSQFTLNLGLKDFFSAARFRLTRKLLYLYILSALLFQARSIVFEVIAVLVFVHVVWNRDRVKLVYVFGVFVGLLVPNLIVLGRLGVPDDLKELVDGLFSFEYSIIFNNFLSAAIEQGSVHMASYSFMPTLQMLVPSPIRDLLSWSVEKSDYYVELSELADIRGGGFSLLAEMFSNFGWSAVTVFLGLGVWIGCFNGMARRAGQVSIPIAAAPLLYVSFILVFRNDFGVFLKYCIQLLIIAWFLQYMIPRKR